MNDYLELKPCFCGEMPEIIEDDWGYCCRCERMHGAEGKGEEHDLFAGSAKTEEGAVVKWNKLIDLIEKSRKNGRTK